MTHDFLMTLNFLVLLTQSNYTGQFYAYLRISTSKTVSTDSDKDDE